MVDVALSDGTQLKSVLLWLYHKPAGSHDIQAHLFSSVYPNMMRFIFADLDNLGIYYQIYSSERGEKIDPRIYIGRNN
jgi:hypothetical protein